MDWPSGENTGLVRRGRLLCARDGPRLEVRHRPQVQLAVGHVDEPRAVRGDGQALTVDSRELLTLAEREREARRRPTAACGLSIHAAAPTIALTTTAVATTGTARLQSGRGWIAGAGAAVPGTVVSNAPSSASDTSPISRTRCLRSFCRQRAQHRRHDRRHRGGQRASSPAPSSGLRASVSETSSPSNARRPVSIS